MTDIRIKDKDLITTPLTTDIALITNDPLNTAVDKSVTLRNLSKGLALELIPDGTTYIKYTDAEKTKLA